MQAPNRRGATALATGILVKCPRRSPFVPINGVPAPGVSIGTAIPEMTRLAQEAHVPFEWTPLSYLEVQAGNVGLLIFALGTTLVYLVLAAKYESWR
jgi:HAE1 family hydrophobic/amphiphilic exporter-1